MFRVSNVNVNRWTWSKHYLQNGTLRLYDSESVTIIILKNHHKEFFDSAGVKGPFLFAVDATPVVPTLRVRGNSVYGLAKEGEVNIRSAEYIINIVSDKSFTKANQVNALILSPLQQSEPFYISLCVQY